jgi:hypothetical protein
MTPAQLTPAQSAEVVWDSKKHKGWTVHLHVGEEVIKYPAPHPGPDQNAADADLVSLAVHEAAQDGYELNPEAVTIVR